ncbi:DUF2312 domain-containing protein [Acetobacter sp. UBA5411]|uniref:DUF2312 domain-containing protein n=1 Tax=Acetobacter sp. UBA5411 TaxID=1945905 RepID=UPI0025B94537|nr:DUF2312 domain-containing protein [Acetobacter sp. UBA5411]
MSDIGHNTGGVAADRLKSLVERYTRLEEEKKGLTDDQKDILTEGASAGFDKKVLRQLIRIVNCKDKDKLRSEEELLDIYRRAIGED